MRLLAILVTIIASACFGDVTVGVGELRSKPVSLDAKFDPISLKYAGTIKFEIDGDNSCPRISDKVAVFMGGVLLNVVSSGGLASSWFADSYCTDIVFSNESTQGDFNNNEPQAEFKDDFATATIQFKEGYAPRNVTIDNEKPFYASGEPISLHWVPDTDALQINGIAVLEARYTTGVVDSWNVEINGTSLATTISQSAPPGEAVLVFNHILASPLIEKCDFVRCEAFWSGAIEKKIEIE